MSPFDLHSRFDNSLYHLARHVRQAGFKNEADRIMRLSNHSKAVVETLQKVFKPMLGDDLSVERANNLAMAVLYYNEGDDLHQYIHDALLKTNESFYDKERTHKLTDQKAWSLAEKAVKQLQRKSLLPKDMN